MPEETNHHTLMYFDKNGDLRELDLSVPIDTSDMDEEMAQEWSRYSDMVAKLPLCTSFQFSLNDIGNAYWLHVFGVNLNLRQYYVWANRLWRKGHPRNRRRR